jgi:hypothetical protein
MLWKLAAIFFFSFMHSTTCVIIGRSIINGNKLGCVSSIGFFTAYASFIVTSDELRILWKRCYLNKLKVRLLGVLMMIDLPYISGLRDKHHLELESLTLTSQPFKTLALFVLAIGQSIRSTCSCVLKGGARLKFLVLLVVTTWVLLLVIDGPHEKVSSSSYLFSSFLYFSD